MLDIGGSLDAFLTALFTFLNDLLNGIFTFLAGLLGGIVIDFPGA